MRANPSTFGFAALPSLLNTEAALADIAYPLDVLKADGVTFFTRYGHGNYYLGHEGFKSIWEEVNKRKAVVFVHPAHPVDTNLVHRTLPQPVLDYPHETTRTAMDMITSGTKCAHPDCKVILSHGGGTVPFLLPRAAQLVSRLRLSSTLRRAQLRFWRMQRASILIWPWRQVRRFRIR